MGGQTTTSSGSANNEDGTGGQSESADAGRAEQGYEGNDAHDPEIGG